MGCFCIAIIIINRAYYFRLSCMRIDISSIKFIQIPSNVFLHHFHILHYRIFQQCHNSKVGKIRANPTIRLLIIFNRTTGYLQRTNISKLIFFHYVINTSHFTRFIPFSPIRTIRIIFIRI